jgi:BMFP domain-containing protein YqiC
MKKNFVLFSAIVGGAFFFQGCQNVEEAVNKAKEEAKAECEAKVEALTTEWTGNLDLVSGERDSLQAVLDSIYAPKETAAAAPRKPAAKKPATTTTTKTTPEPTSPKLDVGQQSGGKDKLDVGQKSGGTGKLKVN